MFAKVRRVLRTIALVQLCIVLGLHCAGCMQILDTAISVSIFLTDTFIPSSRTDFIALVMENRTDGDVWVVLSDRTSIPAFRNFFTIPPCSRFQAVTVIVPEIERSGFYSITGQLKGLAITERRSLLPVEYARRSELVVVDIGQESGQQACKYSEPSLSLALENHVWNASIDIINTFTPQNIVVAEGGESISIGKIDGYLTEAYRYQAKLHLYDPRYPDLCICPYLSGEPTITPFAEAPVLSMWFEICQPAACSAR